METTNSKSPSVIDLFCGAGGFSKGFQMENYNVILGIDNWKKAKKTYEYNHREAKFLLKDIKKVNKSEIFKETNTNNIDVIIGGPPCQGFSLSGNRNKNDKRNNLIFQYARIVKEIKPKVFVMENVEGIKSLDNGKFLEKLIEDLREAGYKDIKYKTLNAADFGIPQFRKRVFIIGNRMKKKIQFPAPIVDKNNYTTLREAINDLPSLENNLNLKNKPLKYNSIPKNKYQKLMRSEEITEVLNHQGTNHWDKTVKMISLVPEGGNWKDIPEKYREEQNFNARYTRFNGDKPSTTVDTGHRHHFHYKENRVPTVRENARRQSFPDDFIFYGSKTSQYRQVGNAVPPFLSKAIAKCVKKILQS